MYLPRCRAQCTSSTTDTSLNTRSGNSKRKGMRYTSLGNPRTPLCKDASYWSPPSPCKCVHETHLRNRESPVAWLYERAILMAFSTASAPRIHQHGFLRALARRDRIQLFRRRRFVAFVGQDVEAGLQNDPIVGGCVNHPPAPVPRIQAADAARNNR